MASNIADDLNGLGRAQLKRLHKILNAECHLLHIQRKKLKNILMQLHDKYIELYAIFPPLRYGKLKSMIKVTATTENLEFTSKISTIANEINGEDSKYRRLLEIVGSEGDLRISTEQIALADEKVPGKGKQALNFILKATGFDSDPIEDEDVMENDNLKRNIKSLRRELNTMYSDFSQSSSALSLMKRTYEDSKGQFFILRYFTLKSNVRSVINETKAETHYESKK